MFTVLLADRETLDAIQRNHLFLDACAPYREIAFCPWDRQQSVPAAAVRALPELVAGKERWRAVVVMGEEGIQQLNPFDLVGYRAPEWREDEEERAVYLARRRAARMAAFDAAAQQPLTRLATYLCEQPTVSEGLNRIAARAAQPENCEIGEGETVAIRASQMADYDEFAEYQAEALYREQLREEILQGSERRFEAPQQILCIAKRCFTDEKQALDTVWSPHLENEYSEFYRYNLYFDRMRYLLYDIVPQSHQRYPLEELRFLYALLTVSGHDMPDGALQPGRVFSLECENDEAETTALISRYCAKLDATVEFLEQLTEDCRREQDQPVDDRQASRLQEKLPVQVQIVEAFDPDTMLVDNKSLGMSSDCPVREKGKWSAENTASHKALARYLVLPPRAVKRGAAEFHQLSEQDVTMAARLNEFQAEDLERYVDAVELSMAGRKIDKLKDYDGYCKDLEPVEKGIVTKNSKRITKGATVAVSVVLLLVTALGFVPFFVSNQTVEQESLLTAGGIALGVLAVLALCLFGCLLALRRAHRLAWGDYNGGIGSIRADVTRTLEQYSAYLTDACSAFRGFAALNYRREYEEPRYSRSRLLKKHMADMLELRSEITELFGGYVRTLSAAEEGDVTRYEYDFHRPVTYEYPMPMTAGGHSMEFIQPGVTVNVPCCIMRHILIRREELYD